MAAEIAWLSVIFCIDAGAILHPAELQLESPLETSSFDSSEGPKQRS